MEEIEPNPIMESWDAVVTSYPDNPGPIDYAKAIRTANIIVAEDLAPFETEWLTKTLLFKPIHLFETIKSNKKRNDEAWVKYIADSIKLLSKLIDTHWDVLENYNQELVELCSLSFDTQTRKEAILCLLKVVKQPSVALTDEFVVNVINAFEKAKSCKAPLAELVGALCRYFPENVRTESRCKLIWRTYLNMFNDPWCPFTNTVLIAVLKGTDDLLASFWEDLDPNELNQFYDRVISRQAKSSKAVEVIISLLEHHAVLFKEKLAKDEKLRNFLWQVEQKNAMEALIKIYQHILPICVYKKQSFTDVKPILSLLTVLLSLQQTEHSTPKWCHSIVPSIVHLARFYRQEPVKMIQEMPDDEMPYVEIFKEDTVYKTLLTLMSTDRRAIYDGTLSSFQAIFSKEDNDYKVLIKILANLETVIEENSSNLDQRQLSLVINQIDRLKYKIVLDNKDARVFQKDVIMFLAKYGQMCLQGSFSEDMYTLKLKNKVYFNIPNIVQGSTLKIDIQRILQLCLLRGETDALYCLLIILTAHLHDRPDPDLQEATIRFIHEIFRSISGKSETDIAVHPALFMCNTTACVQSIIKGITEELDPKVRRKLSEHLQLLLTQDPGSETTGELLNVVAEHSSFMMARDEASFHLPDLDILRAFLQSIVDNNALITEYLPKILIFTSKINDATDIFENASYSLIEKIDLFTHDQILEVIKKVIENYSVNLVNTELIINNSELIVSFIKRVFEIKEFGVKIIIDILLSMLQPLTVISPQFSHLVTLLVYLNLTFEFDNGLRRIIVEFEDLKILEQLLKMNNFEENEMNAGFLFLREFADELLEVSSEKTYQCLGLLIENVTPQSVITLKSNITTCLSVYQSKQNSLSPINENIQNWFKKINIEELITLIEKWFKSVNPDELITDIETRESFANVTKEISEKIHALKIMSEYFKFVFDAKNLTFIAIENIDEKLSKILLIDLLIVCEKHLSDEDFLFVLQNKIDFLKNHVGVFFKRIISKPYVIKKEESLILIDVMNYFATAFDKDFYQDVLDFIDYLWPSFQESTDFEGKLSVLTNVLRLPETVDLSCPPVVWASTLLTSQQTSLKDKIKILNALPAGEQFSSLYRAFATNVPVRISEIEGNEKYVPAFRAVLDSLAINGDMTLLDIVLTLARGDETKGWWDYAFSACMKSLAAKEDIRILNVVYKKVVEESPSMTVCNRILLPLLGHTSRKFFEEYLCTIITELLQTLKSDVIEISDSKYCKKRLIKYAIVVNILKIAFNNLSTACLERGVINERAGSTAPWHFLKTTCKYCVTASRKVKCPTDASEEPKQICLWLQTTLYNCLSTAICRWQITEKLCAELFNVDVWARIVDKEAVHPFYLKSYVRSRDSVRPAKRALNSMASTSSFTGTVRSTIFLTTLSENPLHFDLLPNDDEEEDEDEIISEFEDNALNSHGCLSTITYLLEHASKLEYHGWRDAIVAALSADPNLHTNARWMIAQAVCNASEHLKTHATALCPALFKLVADTSLSSADNGKPVLNNLHVEVLSTIIKWDLKDLPHTPTMDICTEYLINTCMANKTKYYIHKRLLDILNGLLQLYGKHIKVKWDIFEDYLHELPKSLIPILPIFEKLLKNGVSLPNLLGATFSNLNATHWINNGTKLSEVSGLALSKTDSVSRSENLDAFWKILASVRTSNVGSYIKMLFYAQKSCPECCDAHNLRIITGLASKIEKSKCLTIISTYLEHAETVENFKDIIDLINLKELLDSDVRVEAMKIARNSLEYMDIDLKKEILKCLEQNCRSSSTSVRKEAFRVFLKAFEDLVKRDPATNSAKRKALDSTPILDIVDSASSLDEDIVKMVSDGMFDRDLMVAREVCEGVEECLSDDLSMRFAELFYIIVYQRSLTDNDSHLSNYGSKLIEMLFSGLRKEESFMQYKLRDEGLPQSILKAFESTTTHTMTVRTSLRSGVAYRHKENTAPEKRELDLQMPITDILEVLIKVSKINSLICQELCVQIMKCLAQTGRRFNLDAVIAKYLSHIIKRKPIYPTPLILDACRIFIRDISGIEGFLDSVKSLKLAVCNSEAYLYTNILFEDLLIRNNDKNLFLFSSVNEDYDATMDEQGFTMEGLIQAFGSLANWNDLRLQDKKRIEDTLPRLWTSNEDFTVSLRDYFENNKNNLDPGLWFNKMLASYYPDEIIQNKWSWLKHIEKWPRKDFDTSAIIEAIEWHENNAKMFGSISRNDCLVEWSARLMIRWSYYNQVQDSGSDYPGTLSKQELLWCREANERGLPSIALQCIDRNKQNNIPQDEILPWFLEKVKAYRGLGLKQNDLGMLQKALDAAETHSQVVSSHSSMETRINMQKVILDLHHDLNSLSKMTLDDVLHEVSAKIQDSNDSQLSYNSGSALKSIYDTALTYYDDMWTDSGEIFQNELILAMTGIIDKVLDYNLTRDCNLLLATPFNRLAHSDVTISDVAAKALLDQIYRVFPRLDFCSIAILKKIMSVLPATVVNENYLSRLQDVELDTCKQYFQLICDVNYALSQFCEDLRQNVFNDEEFEIIFKKMKDQIFENQFGGTDYQSLSTLKNKLYALEHMDDIDTKAQELKLIRDELLPKTSRTTLRLSQLCPDLCSPLILESKRLHLQRLLRLPPNVHVVKFIEQVTPLGEDSAILEYLEDHIRLRELMDVESK
ncbi:uncharacterized protein LOC111351222 [Spodoptera litura]|uniref:Uncharacterized protein LOC111351222 n=1 Tax=Spodoptera litura TaxID=69820 RepID=A0A9J7DV82_SPOLT|nr:uncharacterized protein LOC111351222 [Spodoptera litura]